MLPLPGLSADAFSGLTVVDLSRLLPGPWCTRLLRDHGARVVKVEAPKGGDYARWYPPLVDSGDTGYGAFFASLNEGKESLALDIRTDAGRALLLTLIERADVLVESFRPGVLERLGLDADTLREANPQLIVCRISGFGQTGPLARRAGHDLNYLALSGALGLAGPPGEPPAPPAVQVADLGGGALRALAAISAALFQRTRSHQGATLDIAMCEGVLDLLVPFVAEHGAGVPSAEGGDGLLTGGVPAYRCYRCADGRYLAVAALEPKFWAELCEAIGRPDLLGCGLDRGAAGERCAAALDEAFSAQPLAHWQAVFAERDACVEPVLTLDEVLAHPHHQARQPAALRACIPAPASGPPPRLGADTRRICEELGLDATRISALEQQGVLALAAD